jgi:hypothetical protein
MPSSSLLVRPIPAVLPRSLVVVGFLFLPFNLSSRYLAIYYAVVRRFIRLYWSYGARSPAAHLTAKLELDLLSCCGSATRPVLVASL